MKRKTLVFITLIALGAATAAEAAVITFTDRASFNAAVGATSQQTFNAYVSEVPFHTTPLDVGDFTLSMTAGSSTDAGRNKIDLQPLEFGVFDVDGTAVANVLTVQGESLFITFDTPIVAFGADFAALNDDFLRTQLVVAGDTLTPPVTAGSIARFFGVQSSTPFTVVELRGLDNDGYAIDNVSYSASVPEPGMLLLVGLGLAAGVRRRFSHR